MVRLITWSDCVKAWKKIVKNVKHLDFRCSAFRWLLCLVPNGPHLIKLKQKTILQFERIYHIQKTKTDDRTDLGQKIILSN